jgi:hypothetical protein
MLQTLTTTHLPLLLPVHHHLGTALATTAAAATTTAAATATTPPRAFSSQAGTGTVGLSLDQPELVLYQPHPAGRLALRLLRAVRCLGLDGREGHLEAEYLVVLGLQLGRELFNLPRIAILVVVVRMGVRRM